jgi:phosphoglycolate phosphatase-like HAD superfamily hydrolase
MLSLKEYKTIIFDFDGVIVNSNKLKARVYELTALAYGASPEQALELANYHVQFGGISRYIKLEYFLTDIVKQPATKEALSSLLKAFNQQSMKLLENCEVAEKIVELKNATPNSRWMVISGSSQDELRLVLKDKNLAHLFEAGIFGSPEMKIPIAEREIIQNNIQYPVLFIGDSRYDYETADAFDFDFVFLTDWTDHKNWPEYVQNNGIFTLPKLANLLDQ